MQFEFGIFTDAEENITGKCWGRGKTPKGAINNSGYQLIEIKHFKKLIDNFTPEQMNAMSWEEKIKNAGYYVGAVTPKLAEMLNRGGDDWGRLTDKKRPVVEPGFYGKSLNLNYYWVFATNEEIKTSEDC